jgi:hypothetical protein
MVLRGTGLCRVRLRLRSSSPPSGDQGWSPHSSGFGHLRASPRALLPSEVLRAARGGCQAPLKEDRQTGVRNATGGRLAPQPRAPKATRRRCAPSRALRGPRIVEFAEYVKSRTGGRAGDRLSPGPRGTGAGHPPVTIRPNADRISFSGARLPHARNGETAGGALLRWPKPSEDDRRTMPPQGGEPERRCDERRTRRPVSGGSGQWPWPWGSQAPWAGEGGGRQRVHPLIPARTAALGRAQGQCFGETVCGSLRVPNPSEHVIDVPGTF